MKPKLLLPILAAAGCLSLSVPARAAVVNVGDSNSTWLGFMNVFDLPENGGGFQFGGGWGVPDLVSTFDDGAETLTLSPNTIGDPNEYWYQNTSGTATAPDFGGPGQRGNKVMEANLYIEETGRLVNQTVTFTGNILADTTTAAHRGVIFIKDFAPDYSSFTESSIPIVPGPFSVSLTTANDPARHVQYGFQFIGENVWVTDTAPFGSVVIGTIPEPSTALLGLLGLGFLARRRR